MDKLSDVIKDKIKIIQLEKPRKIISRGISKEEADEMEKIYDANKPWDIYGDDR